MKKILQALFTLMLAGMVGRVYATPSTGANTNPPPVVTNSAPVVQISSPADGSKFRQGADIQLIAEAGERGGSITSVEFFAGSTSLGVETNFAIVDPVGPPPYLYHVAAFLTWSNVTAGTYALTAVATDGAGVTVTSAPVGITVVSPPPPPPTYPPVVAIVNPTNGSSFYSNATVEVCAAAFETNGRVVTVEFFAGDTSLGIVTNYPVATPVAAADGSSAASPIATGRLCLSWPNVAPGDYTLTAVATDNGGVTATSAPVSLTVSASAPPPPPPVAPLVQIQTPDDGQKFPAGANLEICAEGQEPGGTIVSIEFFAGSTSLGVTTNPVPDTASALTHLGFLCVNWSDVAAGDYVLTAVATAGNGLTGTSAPVNITVISNTPPPPPVNVPPLVAILNPTNGASFDSNANITISATAHDPDGHVTMVEFFAGTNSLGVVTNPPIVVGPPVGPTPQGGHGDAQPDVVRLQTLSLTWSNAAPGDYTLTAVATDNGGLTATSAPVDITVTTTVATPPPAPTNRPPLVTIVNPEDGAVFFANSDIDVCAAARDVDGYVATIEFFAGTTSLGTVTNLPPSAAPRGWHAPLARLNCITWPDVAPGDYVLTAVATDDQGASTTSAPVNITVSTNLPPVRFGGHSN